ncbi:MAG TPA: metal-dependent hydrolase [Candidatus Acidoferrum sp.]
MASLISHAVAALGIGTVSMVPDLDVIGFRFGIRYGDFWGHRGFTHSLLFAAILATLVTTIGFFQGSPGLSRISLFLYFFLATASHGLLDAMTNGGLGVAFFSPFDNTRYFLPWRPIVVSPISVTRFFSERGLAVLQGELLWIWIPTGLLAVLMLVLRRTLLKQN